jgi:hypothetical protein
VEKQNEANRAEGRPEISPAPLLALAEQLVPALRTAEWHDRADAALADVAELDLRDLRSVVVAADAGARDETTRELAEQLRTALAERVESEQTAWLAEVDQMLAEGRAVRALRLSSRPPKAGAPFPADLAVRLAAAASASLTAETGTERFATVLDALAHSPVRAQVTAQGVPEPPGDDLVAAVRKLASRLPQIAAQFGIEAPPAPTRGAKGRPKGKGGRPVPPPPPVPDAAPAAVDAGEPAPVALDAGEPAPVALDPGEPAPVALDPGEPAPVALDAGEPAPVALDPGEPAPVALDPGEPAPVALEATEQPSTETPPSAPAEDAPPADDQD